MKLKEEHNHTARAQFNPGLVSNEYVMFAKKTPKDFLLHFNKVMRLENIGKKEALQSKEICEELFKEAQIQIRFISIYLNDFGHMASRCSVPIPVRYQFVLTGWDKKFHLRGLLV